MSFLSLRVTPKNCQCSPQGQGHKCRGEGRGQSHKKIGLEVWTQGLHHCFKL